MGQAKAHGDDGIYMTAGGSVKVCLISEMTYVPYWQIGSPITTAPLEKKPPGRIRAVHCRSSPSPQEDGARRTD